MNTLGHAVILVTIFVAVSLLGQWLLKSRVKIEVLQEHHSAAEGMLGVVGTLFFRTAWVHGGGVHGQVRRCADAC